MMIPLKQGLKPAELAFIDELFDSRCYDDSIKTRIETYGKEPMAIEMSMRCYDDSIKTRIETH